MAGIDNRITELKKELTKAASELTKAGLRDEQLMPLFEYITVAVGLYRAFEERSLERNGSGGVANQLRIFPGVEGNSGGAGAGRPGMGLAAFELVTWEGTRSGAQGSEEGKE
jgi:hypothetical protein